jgi:hypothetical protein
VFELKAAMEKALVVSIDLSEIFESFEENPVDFGSTAQICWATLKFQEDSELEEKRKYPSISFPQPVYTLVNPIVPSALESAENELNDMLG